jgi:hypothetical protein
MFKQHFCNWFLFLFSGIFDFVGSSHQWWHLIIVVAFWYWHQAGGEILAYRTSTPCHVWRIKKSLGLAFAWNCAHLVLAGGLQVGFQCDFQWMMHFKFHRFVWDICLKCMKKDEGGVPMMTHSDSGYTVERLYSGHSWDWQMVALTLLGRRSTSLTKIRKLKKLWNC